jgi:hypothetical protein
LTTARREESKGTGRRTEKKRGELSLDKPRVFERGNGNTFLKKFSHCTIQIGGMSKIHYFASICLFNIEISIQFRLGIKVYEHHPKPMPNAFIDADWQI